MENNENTTGTGTSNPAATKYKYKDIKVHSSDEWMADSKKKYRRVYDRYETTYMRVEFSFFNKLFDEGEWEAAVTIKCFAINGTEKRELCSLSQNRKVLKDENIVYIRESWGNDTAGSYWHRGDYLWEAYIDNVKAGESKFYIEDLGIAKAGENLYFEIDSIKLFEGDINAHKIPDKKYVTAFKQAETRFINCEFSFKNKADKDYYAEIFFNFYNDAAQLKGTHAYFSYVGLNTAGKIYTIFPGWGGDTPGRWGEDNYTLEVVFMDQLIATVPFTVGKEYVEGIPPILDANATVEKVSKVIPQGADKSADNLLHESLAELNAMTGLHQIKTDVNEMVQLVRFYQESGKDVLSKFSLHTVFTGNPGTGKTTVARILAKIYKGLGILEKGHLVEVDREALVAGFIGQTAIKTAEKVNQAMGGILFIDEAYSLAQGYSNDFGGEAIQVLLKRMEDNRGKFGIIVAGYTDNMHDFIQMNPGLRSRFDKYFEFPDYTPEEMWVIAANMFRKEELTPDEAVVAHLKEYFAFLHSHRDKHFGNARTVRQVVGESVKNQHLRMAALKKEERTPELMSSLIFDDVREFEIREMKETKPRLGFQTGSK